MEGGVDHVSGKERDYLLSFFMINRGRVCGTESVAGGLARGVGEKRVLTETEVLRMRNWCVGLDHGD